MHLHHLTVTTGHSRRSSPSEVRGTTRQLLRPILDAALSGGRPTLPVPGGYALTGTASGRRASTWTVHGPSGPLVTMLVCRRGKCASAWRSIGGAGAQPQHPYCAVRLEEALAHDTRAAEWLGDLERCIAWTWLGEADDDA